jgi:hypothetical protein
VIKGSSMRLIAKSLQRMLLAGIRVSRHTHTWKPAAMNTGRDSPRRGDERVELLNHGVAARARGAADAL